MNSKMFSKLLIFVYIKLVFAIPSEYFKTNYVNEDPYLANLIRSFLINNKNNWKSHFVQKLDQEKHLIPNKPTISLQASEHKSIQPYPIQLPTITSTGEIIIENLIGGISFDCSDKKTGHYQDTNYCDIFHACVHREQRKTYSCPFVGGKLYFDELTRKCEFVQSNPLGCLTNIFFN